MAQANKKTQPRKPMYRTNTPYSQPEVERLQQPQQDAIIDFLVNALSPLAVHRGALPKSKGKRSRKRKRTQTQETAQGTANESNEEATKTQSGIFASPPISSHVLVGFNSVQQHLERLSSRSDQLLRSGKSDEEGYDDQELLHIAAVFLFRSLDEAIYSHLPVLCVTASLANPTLPSTRLVLLDAGAEKRVAAALGLPGASIIALKDAQGDSTAPGLRALLDYVREEVGVLNVEWLKDALEARWLATKVDIQ